MSSTKALPRPMPRTTDKTKSVLFTLHGPSGHILFEDAVKRDMILRGIPVAELIALPAVAPHDVAPRVGGGASVEAADFSVLGAVASRPERGTPHHSEKPFTMATGAPFPSVPGSDSPLGSTRASTPLLAHSASSSSNRPNTTSVAPSTMAGHSQRLITLQALNVDSTEFVSSAGYSLRLEASVPMNWSNHGNVKEKTTWAEAEWTVVAADDGTRLKYSLLFDTGRADSWMYCNLAYQFLGKNIALDIDGDDILPWDDRVHAPLYARKPKIPIPPRKHVEDDKNKAWITYGTQEYHGDVVIAQTIVKLSINTTARQYLTIPRPSPMGVILATTPPELCLSHDGLLGHGRRFGGKATAFGPSPLWRSKTLVEVMMDAGTINEDVFTVYIDHPRLAPQMPSCIIYGTPYDPKLPPIPLGPNDNWTALPVCSTPGASGNWTLRLVNIILHAKTDGGMTKRFRAAVNAHVQVDSGATATFLPTAAGDYIREVFAAVGLRSTEWRFHPRDDVELVFDPDGTGQSPISIFGQARRFFESAHLGEDGEPDCACVGTSGNNYLLGLNFFMTFMLSFQDASIGAQICAHPHTYAV